MAQAPHQSIAATLVIHGVGSPAAGSLTRDLVQSSGNVYEESVIHSGGADFRVFTPKDKDSSPLIDMNWADIGRPRAGIVGVISATLDVAISQPAQSVQEKLGCACLQKFYTVSVFAVFAWTQFIAYGAIAAKLLPTSLLRGLAVLSLAIIGAFVMFRKIRQSHPKSALFGFCSFFLFLSVACLLPVFFDDDELRTRILDFAINVNALGHCGATVLLLAVAVVLARKIKIAGTPSGIWHYLGALACYCVPVIVLSALAAALTAVVFRLADSQSLIREILASSPYDVRPVEFAMAVATAFPIVVVLAGVSFAAIFRLNDSRYWNLVPRYLIASIPIAMLFPFGALIWSLFGLGEFFVPVAFPKELPEIYAASAARVVPWLLGALPFVRELLDVLCDVALYTTANGGLNIKAALASRFKAAEDIASAHDWKIRTVLAHSQGSVVAYDALANNRQNPNKILGDVSTFLTFGSPLENLYRDILGKSVEVLPSLIWRNVYRNQDYIGGRLECLGNENYSLGAGSHTNYLRSSEMIAKLRQWKLV